MMDEDKVANFVARTNMNLGDFLADLMDKVDRRGSGPDACVLCGNTTRLLHPVGRAWACSRCHNPPDDPNPEDRS